MPRRSLHSALGTALVAATAAFAPAAHADRVGFSVSIGGPGYAVAFGDGPYWGHRHRYYAPAPVYVAPPVVYSPRPVYVAPRPRIVYRAPYAPRRIIVREPVYYYGY